MPSTRMPAIWPTSAAPPKVTDVPSTATVNVGCAGAPIHCSAYRVVVRLSAAAGEYRDIDLAGSQIGIQCSRVRPAAINAAVRPGNTGFAGSGRIERRRDHVDQRDFHIGLVGHQVVACFTVMRQPRSVSSAAATTAFRPRSSVIRSDGSRTTPGIAGSRTVQ